MKKKAISLLLAAGIIVSSAFGVYADDVTVFSEYETEEVETATQDEAGQDTPDTGVTEETENAEEETSADMDASDSIPEEDIYNTETPDNSEKEDEAGEPATASDDIVTVPESPENNFGETVPKVEDTITSATTDSGKESTYTLTDDILLEEQGIIASGKCGPNLRWSFDSNGTLTITGSGKMNKCWDWHTPTEEELAMHGDPPETEDTSPWLSYKNRITTIVLQNGVESIGEGAFDDCKNLKTVSIPNSVTSIEMSAFRGCESLLNVSIPNSVKVLGLGAFNSCSSLTSITIPNSVTDLGMSAFGWCTSLKIVVIPASITTIPLAAFSGCSSLTAVKMTDSVKEIQSYAFERCTSLTTVDFFGSKAEWDSINIQYSNDPLINATKNFNVFLDVPLVHSYSKSVYWAVNKGIAAGYTGAKTGYFGVKDNITRGQVVMFLWRAAGKPNPKKKTQTFTDVPTSHNFFKAIQWAYEQGITAGYSSGKFGLNNTCKRGQICTFLWRFAGKPAPKKNTQTFKDVPKSHGFYKAVQWASEQKITAGIGNGLFGVDDPCTRGQCVTFLYRFL